MLNFMPVLVFLAVSYLIYLGFPKAAGAPTFINFAICFIAFLLFTDLALPFYIAQSVAASLLFFLMVTFLGGKTSLTTILTVCGVIALNPGIPGVIALILSLVISVVFGVVSLMKDQNNTIQQVGLQVASTTGVMHGGLPDVDSLPDRKEVGSNTKVFSIASFFFLPYLIVGLVVLLV